MRWLSLTILISLLPSCASDSGAGLSNADGGQTGSLVPPDCTLPAADNPLQVSEGDAAFVAYVPNGAAAEATLVDAAQMPVELSFESVDGTSDAKVARSAQALTAGQYEVIYQCNSPLGPVTVRQPLTVAPANPLPTNLGTLEATFEPQQSGCGNLLAFELGLTPEAIAYEQLIELQVSINDQTPFTVAPFGTLNSVEGVVDVTLRQCDDRITSHCLPNGQSMVTVTARVAGETADVEPVTLIVEARCRGAQDAEQACSVRPEMRPWGTRSLALLGAMCTVALWRRRRTAERSMG